MKSVFLIDIFELFNGCDYRGKKTNTILIVCIIKIVIDFIEKTAADISSLEFARKKYFLP